MQVLNRMTHDETRNTGGIKIGDYGTGGRTYVNKITRKRRTFGDNSGELYGSCGKAGLAGFAFAALLVLGWTERSLYRQYQVLDESSGATILRSANIIAENNGDLVHLISQSPHFEGKVLEDREFNIEFKSAGEVRRITQYCQWEEIVRVEEIVVGQRPDRCVDTSSAPNNADCTGPNAVDCGSRHGASRCRSDDDCCQFVTGEDLIEELTSFEYHKGWRSHRINSLVFDNALSYHNPQRDPMPGYARRTEASIALGHTDDHTMTPALKVSTTDALDGLLPYRPMALTQRDAEGVSQAALRAGFWEADNRHFYSRVQEDGTLMAAAKVAGIYLLEGVTDLSAISSGVGLDSILGRMGLEWITKGSCQAGDIRVSFSQRALPAQLTVLGEQAQGWITPHRYTNGDIAMLARPGPLPLDTLLGYISTDAGRSAWWWRLGAAVLVCIGCTVGGDSMLSGPVPTPLKALLPALVLSFAAIGICWGVLYGAAAALYPLGLGVGIPIGLGIVFGGRWGTGAAKRVD